MNTETYDEHGVNTKNSFNTPPKTMNKPDIIDHEPYTPLNHHQNHPQNPQSRMNELSTEAINEIRQNPTKFDVADILKASKGRNKCYTLSDIIERIEVLHNEHEEHFSKTFFNDTLSLKEYTERLGADFCELAAAVKYLTEISLHQHNQN